MLLLLMLLMLLVVACGDVVVVVVVYMPGRSLRSAIYLYSSIYIVEVPVDIVHCQLYIAS